MDLYRQLNTQGSTIRRPVNARELPQAPAKCQKHTRCS